MNLSGSDFAFRFRTNINELSKHAGKEPQKTGCRYKMHKMLNFQTSASDILDRYDAV